MRGLRGRVAVVTGAGAGIGRAVAARLATEGMRVALLDRDGEAAEQAAQALDGSIGVTADVADAGSVEAAIGRVTAELGQEIHVLVNNAGNSRPAMFGKMSEADFESVVDVHLAGTFRVAKAVLPHIPTDGSGRIINSTSAAGLVGTMGQANYAAAKAGIIGLSKSLAKELARDSITVNAVAPLAATAMTETVRTDPKFAERQLARIPLGRWAEPDEVAGSFAFLASDDAGYMTGQVLVCDGGLVI